MSETITTTIDMIRHGEPVGGKKYRGQLDDPLSEKGWRQMREAVSDHCPWEVVVSSPLSRCLAFAKELAERHGLPLEREEGLKEIGFGEWEGRTAAELMAEEPDILRRFWSDPLNNTPPGAETLAAFRDRVIPAFEATAERHRGKHLLIVGHAGMMRMVMRHVLEMPLEAMFRIQVANAGITRLMLDHHDDGVLPRLVFHHGTL